MSIRMRIVAFISTPRGRAWLWAGLWTAFIYGTLGVMRPVSTYLRGVMPFGTVINITLGMLLGGITVLILLGNVRGWVRRCILGATVTAYAVGLWLVRIPEERVHFLQYGVLTVLLVRALRWDVRDWRVYPVAVVLGGLIGWGDEGIQHVLPERFFQWADVRLNVISCALAALLMAVRDPGSGRDTAG